MIELRTITIDFASQTIVSSYLLGKIGEHNATKLSITPPTSLSGDARTSIYRVSFGTGGKSFLSESFTTVPFTIDLWKQLTECPRMSIQIIAYDSDGEYVGKSDKLTGFYFESSINGIEVEVDGENHDIANEILKVKSDLASEVARAEAAESGKVDKVSGKGLSTNDYTDAEKNKLASLTNNNPFYGTCSTSGSTADKVVTVDSTFALQNGVMVIVKFSNDCYKPTVGNVTLNVNGTGARTIVCGALSPNIVKIPATTTVAFVLSGNYWIQLGYYKATDTSPGFVKLSDAIDSDFGVLYQTAATPYAVKKANDNANTRYLKPASGIPYSDMSEAVQASLDKADSAAQDIEDIEEKIPAQATSENKLADKAFVNSSIATNTAYFRGTYNSVAELEAYSGEKTNNDYAFVISTDSSGNTVYNRYKWNGTAWVFEYALNNSSFTAAQWAAISSAITAAKVTSYDSHLNNLVTSVSSSSTDEEYPSAKCVYDLIGDVSTAIASINALIGGASE